MLPRVLPQASGAPHRVELALVTALAEAVLERGTLDGKDILEVMESVPSEVLEQHRESVDPARVASERRRKVRESQEQAAEDFYAVARK